MPAPRTRLQPGDRREVLLEAASELFGAQPYEVVRIEEVATRSGCSRALLYHYFPSKQALFVAVVRRSADQLAARTQPDPELAPIKQLAASIAAYFRWAEQNSVQYKAMYRSATSDPEVHAFILGARRRQENRILDALPEDVRSTGAVQLTVRGWVTFVTHMCLDWLEDDRGVPAEQISAMCVSTLTNALQAALTPQRAAHG